MNTIKVVGQVNQVDSRYYRLGELNLSPKGLKSASEVLVNHPADGLEPVSKNNGKVKCQIIGRHIRGGKVVAIEVISLEDNGGKPKGPDKNKTCNHCGTPLELKIIEHDPITGNRMVKTCPMCDQLVPVMPFQNLPNRP